LHRPQIDAITFTRGGKTYRRVAEVIDCWFDSGAMTYAQWHYPFENRDAFDAHFPADYICEAIDQTRGWFYTLHAIAALVSDSVAFKNCVCLSHIVDANGKKMSKSQGNIVDPYDVFDHIGADSLRWLFLARTAPEGQKRISTAIVREVTASFVNTFWNTYAFFVLYARLDEVDLMREVDHAKRPEIDRWILALAHQTVRAVTDALDAYDARRAGEAIEKLVDQLSNWYVRRNRRRFWKNARGDDKQSAYLTLFECLDLCTRIIAPFMPFLAEAVYRNLHRAAIESGAAESVHLTAWPEYNAARIDAQLIFEMDAVQQVVALGRAAREESRIRVRQPLPRLLIAVSGGDGDARAAIDKHRAQITAELNIKSVDFIARGDDLVSYALTPDFRRLGKRYGKLMPAIKAALAGLSGTAAAAQVVAQVDAGAAFTLPVDTSDGVTQVEFEPADIRVQTAAAQGFACARDGRFLVALDTALSDELVVEGVAREVVRSVQDARKAADLDIAARITLTVAGTPRVVEALRTHREYIIGETLAAALTVGDGDAGAGDDGDGGDAGTGGDGDGGDAGAGGDDGGDAGAGDGDANTFTAAREVGDDRWRLAFSKVESR